MNPLWRIDKMIDDAICRMTQRTAQMILSVYWAMHEDEEERYNHSSVYDGL